jgi:hypothetical protein
MTAHSSNLHTDHLGRLSDEVSRIAIALARLSTTSDSGRDDAANRDLPVIRPEFVRSEIRARRLRGRYFEEDLFADPAWDILLDLFEAELTQRRISVSSACAAAAVPATTALRWITSMVKRQLLVRRNDPLDARRVFVELAPSASLSMRRYFGDILRIGSPEESRRSA